MSLRFVLICFALLAMVCAQPTPGAPEVTENSEPVEETTAEPVLSALQRTLFLLLPLLFPNTFYIPTTTG
ncbi:uncharacterized protein LOC119560762 [Drosophila subpulchrella]|uniref:uncharacterized protein LOC119560762 n=1 Tax=Drosophila subpulchrella TaxID=1486046 RepID=UPI0018A1ABA7|nr:uncharacterized protein LOC119560762 [Drosophila subpulchrella]